MCQTYEFINKLTKHKTIMQDQYPFIRTLINRICTMSMLERNPSETLLWGF